MLAPPAAAISFSTNTEYGGLAVPVVTGGTVSYVPAELLLFTRFDLESRDTDLLGCVPVAVPNAPVVCFPKMEFVWPNAEVVLFAGWPKALVVVDDPALLF